MFKRTLVTAAVLVAVAGPAFASSCPKHMKEIDAALAESPKVTEAQMADVKKFRMEGERLHNAGQHGESEDALNAAKKILGLE